MILYILFHLLIFTEDGFLASHTDVPHSFNNWITDDQVDVSLFT